MSLIRITLPGRLQLIFWKALGCSPPPQPRGHCAGGAARLRPPPPHSPPVPLRCPLAPLSPGERPGGCGAVAILTAGKVSPTLPRLPWQGSHPPHATCQEGAVPRPCCAVPGPAVSSALEGHEDVVALTCPCHHEHPHSCHWLSLQRQAGGHRPASSHPEGEGRILFQAGFARESTTTLPLRCPGPAPRDVKLKAAN